MKVLISTFYKRTFANTQIFVVDYKEYAIPKSKHFVEAPFKCIM